MVPNSGTFNRRGATAETIVALQGQIRSARLLPGDRLASERALSEEFGVSRPTIREAVQALVALNILESRHGSGIYVRSLGIDELLMPMRFALELTEPTLHHLFEVRLALEPLAAELAASRSGEEVVRELRELVKQFRSRRRTRVQRVDLDIRFHERVVEASENPLLSNVVKSLAFLSRKSREITVRRLGVIDQTLADHAAVVDAIEEQSPARARQAMTVHLEHVRAALGVPGGETVSAEPAD